MAFHAFLLIVAVLYCSAKDISIVEQTNTGSSAALKYPNSGHNSAQSGTPNKLRGNDKQQAKSWWWNTRTPTLSSTPVPSTCSPPCSGGQVCVQSVCVGSGTLRFTLTWDRPGDLDLHVIPPCGSEIYFADREYCGGTLDHDDLTGQGPENIFWDTPYTPGTYTVCAVAYKEEVVSASYTIEVHKGSQIVRTITGIKTGQLETDKFCSQISADNRYELTL